MKKQKNKMDYDYDPTTEDIDDLGNCRFCGSPNVRSRTTGKVYCSARCWDKRRPASSTYQRPAPAPNWDAIRKEKNGEIRKNVVLKEACEMARAMYERGEITASQLIPSVQKMVAALQEIAKEL